jgi:hypothetical protein
MTFGDGKPFPAIRGGGDHSWIGHPRQLPRSPSPAMMRRVPRRVLILAAIQMEADAIAGALKLTFATDKTSATGLLPHDLAIELKLIGVRGRHIPDRLDPTDLKLIISAGLAGGLDPALKCGDVVADSPESLEIPGARSGRIHSSDSVVATPAQKAELFRQTGAMAVDMETASIRRLADSISLPCIAIRAISDESRDMIDPAVMRLVDSLGRMRVGKVVALLIRRPGSIRHLLRLKANSDRALKELGGCLSRFLESF